MDALGLVDRSARDGVRDDVDGHNPEDPIMSITDTTTWLITGDDVAAAMVGDGARTV